MKNPEIGQLSDKLWIFSDDAYSQNSADSIPFIIEILTENYVSARSYNIILNHLLWLKEYFTDFNEIYFLM